MADELACRIPGSFVSDPEPLGFAIRRMMPPEMRRDFQSYLQWRSGVVAVLEEVDAAVDGVVIVPGGLFAEEHLDEVIGELRRRGHEAPASMVDRYVRRGWSREPRPGPLTVDVEPGGVVQRDLDELT